MGTFLTAYRKLTDGERRYLHAGERIVVFVADTDHILDDVEIVARQGDSINGVLNHAIFAPETVGSDAEFATHGATAGAAFEAHHQETLGEELQ